MRIFKIINLTTLFFIFFLTVKGQNNTIRVIEDFETLSNNFSIEKMYIETNKPIYLIGEKVLYTAFLVDHKTLTLSNVSNIAYIELINFNNKTVLRRKVKVEDGIVKGTFFLPDSISSGGYMLKGYTQWMKNFGRNSFFEKEIIVINPMKISETLYTYKRKNHHNGIKIDFFPEGGNLLQGFNTKIGFKVTNNQKSISIDGFLVSNEKDTLTTIKSNKDGIGSFDLNPLKDTIYTVVFNLCGRNYSYELPSATTGVFGLKMTESQYSNNLNLQIVGDSSCFEMSGREYHLLVETRGNIDVSQSFIFDNNDQTIKISKENLSNGINHIILFNENEEIMLERLWFTKDPGGQVELLTNDTTFLSREQVECKISSKSSSTAEVDFVLMMSATSNCESLQKTNLVSYMYLQAALIEYIEDPTFYISNQNQKSLEELLLVSSVDSYFLELAKQGNQFYSEYKPERTGLTISGEVIDINTNTPLVNQLLFLGIPGNKTSIQYTNSTSNGRFNFYLTEPGLLDIVIQTVPNLSNALIKIDDPFWDDNVEIFQDTLKISEEMLDYINNAFVNQQIGSIYQYYDKSLLQGDSANQGSSFYGKPYFIVKVSDYLELPTVTEIIHELVRAVKVNKKKGQYYLKVYNTRHGEWLPGIPTVFVDGIFVDDLETILDLDPKVIDRIEVVNWVHFQGRLKMNGIFSLYTHKKTFTDIDLPGSALRRRYQSFDAPYDDSQKVMTSNPRYPYFVNDLFWNPGKQVTRPNTNMEFNTSDEVGEYIIRINGVSQDGKLFYQEKKIKVIDQ